MCSAFIAASDSALSFRGGQDNNADKQCRMSRSFGVAPLIVGCDELDGSLFFFGNI